MVNPFKEINWKPSLGERRKFGLSLVIGCPGLALAFLIVGWLKSRDWSYHGQLALWLTLGGVGVGLLCLVLPRLATPFYRAVYFFACCTGIIVGNLMLCALYYLLLTLIGVAKRAAGETAFRKEFDKKAKTYWQDVEPVADPSRYFKQF